jgi:hypothetical protein
MIRKSDVVLLATLFVCLSTPAFAYLDPGTGSMIAQVIIGALAAALVSIKLAWKRINDAIASVFRGKPNPRAVAKSSKE